MRTRFLSNEEGLKERKWVQVDAAGVPLGRLASRIASILRGKNKSTFAPHTDVGDFVIVVNAAKVKLTGNKMQDKVYRDYTGYIGGLKERKAADVMEKNPSVLITRAVKTMIPQGPLGYAMLRKLKVFNEDKHTHGAQCPTTVVLVK